MADTLPPPPSGVTFADTPALPPPPAGVQFMDSAPPSSIPATPEGVEWADEKPGFWSSAGESLAGGPTAQALVGTTTSLANNLLMGQNPDTVARLLGPGIGISGYETDWANALNDTNDQIVQFQKQAKDLAQTDVQGSREATIRAIELEHQAEALRAQNPANIHNRFDGAVQSIEGIPKSFDDLQVSLIAHTALLLHDPMGQLSQGGKAVADAVKGGLDNPMGTLGHLAGSLLDPLYWLVPAGGAGTLSKGMSDLLKVTGRQTAVGVGLTGVNSALAQQNMTHHVDFAQTVEDMTGTLAPMMGLSFLGAGVGFARGTKGETPGMKGGPNVDLSTPEQIAEHHGKTFKEILNPEEFKPEIPSVPEVAEPATPQDKKSLKSALAKLSAWEDKTEAPPIQKDDVSDVAGNMAQQHDKSPEYVLGSAGTMKAMEEQVFPERAEVPRTALDQVKNTKALDEDGKPLILYRGQKIDAPGTGSFYTTSQATAGTYADYQPDVLATLNAQYPKNWPETTPIGEEPAMASKPGLGGKPKFLAPLLAPNMGKYVVQMDNPFVVDMGGQSWTDQGIHEGTGKQFSLGEFTGQDWFDDHPEHDGIIVKNVRDAAYGNYKDQQTLDKFGRPLEPSTIVITKDPSQAVNFWNHKNRLEGGFAKPALLAGGALATIGAEAGYGYEHGQDRIGGAIAGGLLGVLTPFALGALKNSIGALMERHVPNAADMAQDEFVQHMREARFVPLQLASQFKKVLSPEVSKRINIAQHHGEDALAERLSPTELAAKKSMDGLYDTYGKALNKAGVIDELRKNYVARILKPMDNAPAGFKGDWEDYKKNWYTKLSPAKARKYTEGSAGIAAAAEDGLTLKHQFAEDNLAEYAGLSQELLARNKYARQLFTDGPSDEYNWIMPSNKAPRFYAPMAGSKLFGSIARTVNKNLTPKWEDLSKGQQLKATHWLATQAPEGATLQTYLRQLGPHLPVSSDYAIHPEAADIHNFLFRKDESNAFWRKFDAANLQLKQAKLSFTLFHAKTMVQHHLNLQDFGMANPAGYKDIPSIASGSNPIFEKFLNNDPVTQLAIKHGLAINPAEDWEGAHSTLASDEFNKWLKDVVPEEFQVPGVAGVRAKVLQTEEAFKKLTFGRFMTGFKLLDATSLFNKERLRDQARLDADPTYRSRSDDEIMKGVVSLLNNVYGVQNYQRLVMDARSPAMRHALSWIYSPTGRKILQRVLLAPDWLISTTRSMGHALLMGGKEAAKLHAPYMLRSAFYYLLAANMTNYISTGHSILQNKDPLTTELGGNRTVMLDKAFSDPLKLFNLTRPATMTQAWLSKGSPLLEEGIEQLSNRSFMTPYGAAPPIVSPRDDMLMYWGKRAYHATGLVEPIPLQQFLESPSLQPLGGFMGVPIYSHRKRVSY